MWFDPRTECPRLYSLDPSEGPGVASSNEGDDQFGPSDPDPSETLASIREADPSF